MNESPAPTVSTTCGGRAVDVDVPARGQGVGAALAARDDDEGGPAHEPRAGDVERVDPGPQPREVLVADLDHVGDADVGEHLGQGDVGVAHEAGARVGVVGDGRAVPGARQQALHHRGAGGEHRRDRAGVDDVEALGPRRARRGRRRAWTRRGRSRTWRPRRRPGVAVAVEVRAAPVLPGTTPTPEAARWSRTSAPSSSSAEPGEQLGPVAQPGQAEGDVGGAAAGVPAERLAVRARGPRRPEPHRRPEPSP